MLVMSHCAKSGSSWAKDHGRKWSELLYKGSLQKRIPSKKNSRRVGVSKRTGRVFNIPSAAYNQAKDLFVEQISSTITRDLIQEPCLLVCKIYDHSEGWFESYLNGVIHPKEPRGSDCDNTQASVQDILCEAGVVWDDCLFVETATRKYMGQKHPEWNDYGAEIEIYGLDSPL